VRGRGQDRALSISRLERENEVCLRELEDPLNASRTAPDRQLDGVLTARRVQSENCAQAARVDEQQILQIQQHAPDRRVRDLVELRVQHWSCREVKLPVYLDGRLRSDVHPDDEVVPKAADLH
jgi:hypothetical protein